MERKRPRKKQDQPLLYVAQPVFGGKKISMQETFVIKPAKKQELSDVREQEELVNIQILEKKREPEQTETLQEKNVNVEEVEEASEELHQIETAAPSLEDETAQRAVGHVEDIVAKLENDETMELEVCIAAAEEAIAHDELEEEVQQIAAENLQPISGTIWKSKPFKDMTIAEQVAFLVDRPHYIPETRCRIRTTQGMYIAYILAYDGEYVTVKGAVQLRPIQIPLKEIVSIRMIGF